MYAEIEQFHKLSSTTVPLFMYVLKGDKNGTQWKFGEIFTAA